MTSDRKLTRRRVIGGAGAALAVPMLSAGRAAAQGSPLRIGILSDMSGAVVDLSGPGTATAMKMAIEDFGGSVLGRRIELLEGDHLNRPDTGTALARRWYDDGVAAIFDIGITTVAIGVQTIARERNKLVVFLSSASSDLTGQHCSPNGIHWTYNNYSQALGVVEATMRAGGDSWYFLTVNYAYGHNVQRDTTAMIERAGGRVVGSVVHPFETTDFSSFLVQAQASGAKVVGLATTTVHAANIVKQCDEFGIRPGMRVAALSLTLHDTKAMGLQTAQGLLETAPYYWDQNDATRAFGQRFLQRFRRMPNMIQASAYGAVTHYLNAVRDAGTDDTATVVARMKATPINDFMTRNGRIRPDGRVMRDMYVFEAKTPAESRGEWDIYKQIAEIPAERAFQASDPAACALAR